MCEEITLPPECILPLPEWMGLDEAVLLEPLSIAVHAAKRSNAPRGCRAAIVGAGPIGLASLLAVSEYDPTQILVSEPVGDRRAAALKLGAQAAFDPGPGAAADAIFAASNGGVDVAIECCGTQESIDDAAGMVRPGGTLVLIGIPEVDRISYDPHLARRREITTVNVRRQNRCVEQAMSILEHRRDAARVLLTHRFPPQKAKEAFDLVQQKADGVIKAVLEF
jgi:L-iditol 2-dehydrogenase